MPDARSDAKPDAPPDARVDAPPDSKGCPAGYAAIPNGPVGSQFKLFSYSATAGADQSQAWTTAQTTCSSDGTHLAFPADANEAAALAAAIGVNPSSPYFWIGITDAATEGTWLTVLGGAAPYAVWYPGQPDGGTAQECAVEYTADDELFDYYCTTAFPFACECN